MDAVCIIPARGGSKRLPRKNLLPLAGKPLLAHSIEHARRASLVRRVIVSTEDTEIAAIARTWGAEVVVRPAELATDTATSESVLLHALDHVEQTDGRSPELVVFLQCTSPIRAPGDIDAAIQLLRTEEADSLFSACRNDKFVWRREAGALRPLNYDYRARPREQDFPEEYRENGSIYVFRPWVLRQLGSRLGGVIAVFEMGYWSSFQIDSLEDLELCEWILQRARRTTAGLPAPPAIVVFDFDGVFTDNRVLVMEDGREAVWCDRADGLGIARLRELGVPIVVLSTEANSVVAARCRKLGIECRQGVRDKLAVLRELLDARSIEPKLAVFVGNDVNDLECMRFVGCGVAPADAAPAVRDAAKIVLAARGGRGAVREICDLVVEVVAGRGER